MADTIFIYSISDPSTNLVRYIGKTKDVKERFRKHLTENNKTRKSKWMKGLRSKGLKPVFEIIDECLISDWQEKEIGYIKLFKSIGADLLNQARGGEGGATMLGRKLTAEQCKKISDSKIGKPNKGAAVANKIHKGYPVYQKDLNGNILASYLSVNEAAQAINRSARRIQAQVNGDLIRGLKVKTVGGYVFEYQNSKN